MPLWKIVVEGQTPFDVQGVNLRESIVRVASGLGINCIVRNRKGTKLVEVICRCDNENEVMNLKEGIINIPERNRLVKKERIGIWEPEEYKDCAINEENISGFEIEREDDLTEMVWALQNAGKALQLQEDIRREMKFVALNAEIDAFREVLKTIDEGNPNKIQFTVVAIEGFIREPPSGCERDLIALLHQLYRSAKTINNMIDAERGREEMPLDEVQKTLKQIEEILRGTSGAFI